MEVRPLEARAALGFLGGRCLLHLAAARGAALSVTVRAQQPLAGGPFALGAALQVSADLSLAPSPNYSGPTSRLSLRAVLW